jgi:hypothetical protein
VSKIVQVRLPPARSPSSAVATCRPSTQATPSGSRGPVTVPVQADLAVLDGVDPGHGGLAGREVGHHPAAAQVDHGQEATGQLRDGAVVDVLVAFVLDGHGGVAAVGGEVDRVDGAAWTWARRLPGMRRIGRFYPGQAIRA